MFLEQTASHPNQLVLLAPTKEELRDINLLFYATKKDKVAKRLQRLMEVLVSQEQLEMCRTFRSLSRRLHQPSNDLGIAVLTGASAKELGDILSLRDHLSDIRIMLILPDRERDTISKADSFLGRDS